MKNPLWIRWVYAAVLVILPISDWIAIHMGPNTVVGIRLPYLLQDASLWNSTHWAHLWVAGLVAPLGIAGVLTRNSVSAATRLSLVLTFVPLLIALGLGYLFR